MIVIGKTISAVDLNTDYDGETYRLDLTFTDGTSLAVRADGELEAEHWLDIDGLNKEYRA